MKGDFSWFDYQPADNFTGVLEQQGRVRLDRDGLAAEEIGRNLRSLMGRDAFGPGRVAVPAEVSGSLRVTAAESDGTSVTLTLNPGHAWIDGIPLVLSVELTAEASYLPPPFQPEVGPGSIGPDVRDAAVLELWEDSLSGFQDPTNLLEPALGGVDTSERIKVFHRLRLRRLGEDEDCATIGRSLRDDPATIGRLTVTPNPAIAITGDCPIEAGGGYTGDGHRLFCIEIAPESPGGPSFTWSRLGGGLVGRGRFDAAEREITIIHNQTMIAAAGVEGFLLQALAPDPATGEWSVRFTARVSTSSTGGVLTTSDEDGTWPAAPGETAFFRIWDGIAPIADFVGAPDDLADGIQLEFTPVLAGGANYRPGDRWLFPARAAGSDFDPSVWPQDALPMAIRYHRAPLAILHWSAAPPNSLTAPLEIEDCRDSFPPLTDPSHCCTLTVGDGRSTHGDTDSIEEAIARLPAAGGRICLLPGIHECNAVIRERGDIRITGCGKHSRVIPRPGGRELPIFHVIDSECIKIDSLDMISLSGTAILAESSDDDALRQFTVADTRILACARAIQVEGGSETVIRGNSVRMIDKAGAGMAIYLTGEDSRIEDNDIGVVPAEATPVPPDRPEEEETPDDPTDPCADADLIYSDFGFFIGFIEFVFGFTLTAIVPPPYQALGGIQIGGGAERVSVIDNRILGGAGNGVTLGGSHLAPGTPGGGPNGPEFQDVNLNQTVLFLRASVIAPDNTPAQGVTIRMTAPSGTARSQVTDTNGSVEFPSSGEAGNHRFEALDPSLGVETAVITQTINLGAGSIVLMRIELNQQREQPDPRLGFLYEIRIEDNEISAMGLNGIAIPPAQSVLRPAPERPQASTGAGTLPADDRVRVASAPRFQNSRAAAVNPLLARLGHPVIDLTILNNRIIGNLRTPFTAAMRDEARLLGFGGISLGLCETVTISGNRIESNGRRHIDPVCGIFILLGEQVEITDNLIRDNGPFVDENADIERGQRGGIIGIFLSIGLDEFNLDNENLAAGKPALRVHDNVVQQPLGRALTTLGAGPISIVANHLTTERTSNEILDLMAGSTLVYSLSGLGILPAGGCLVNSNQITLGPDSEAFIAVTIAAAQDLGLDGNQIDAMQSGVVAGNRTLMLNTLISAGSVRVTDNRFRERTMNTQTSYQASLLSFATRMNSATSNQGDHCIIAFNFVNPQQLVDEHNLEAEQANCELIASAVQGGAKNPVFGTAGITNLRFQQNAAIPSGQVATYAANLDNNLVAINGYQQARLAEAAEAKAASRALLVNEVARMETRASTRADLVAANQIRLDASLRDTAKLRGAAEVVASKPELAAEEEEGGLVVQGRVLDRDNRAVALREVQLADSEGNPLTGVGNLRTDKNGNYVFRLNQEQLQRNEDRVQGGLTVVALPDEEGGEAVTTVRVALEPGTVVVPALTLNTGFTRPVTTTPVVRPVVVEQPLARPVLTRGVRLNETSSRIAPLVRNSRPRPGGGA